MIKAVYEDDRIRNVTGETLRPGGFFITERALSFCSLEKDSRALDVGCGMGATVEFLREKMGKDAFGIDPSKKLIELGKRKGNLPLILGSGESLPYSNDFFDLVFTECTLSLMDDQKRALNEISRVLKPKGYYIISDVYGKRPEYISDLRKTNVQSCLGNLFDLEKLSDEIVNLGFEMIVLEDWSSLLKKLMVEIIFKYGSMKKFWNMTTCSNCDKFMEKLKLCRPGYFLMIVRRVEI